jgi:anti-sigma factor ChrR (cupin superfamily)
MSREGLSFLCAAAQKIMAETPEAAMREKIAAFVDYAVSVAGGTVDEHASADPSALPWTRFRDGVDIIALGTAPGGEAAALLRYVAQGAVPHHSHPGNEHILILDGSQTDQRGHYPRGALVHNTPGSSHSVVSSAGCLVAIVWEKPIIFSPENHPA